MDKTNGIIQQEMVAIPMIEMNATGNSRARPEVALPPLPKEDGNIGGKRYWDAHSMQEHARAAIALPGLADKPFMYAIMDPAGHAYIDEHCVAGNAEALHLEVNGLNDSPDTGYQIVPVYRGAQPVQQPTPVAEQALIGYAPTFLVERMAAGDPAVMLTITRKPLPGYGVAIPLYTAAPTQSFQQRVRPWMMMCFGAEISADKHERNHRFFEESTELVQACGMTASEAHQLVDYVYGRAIGDPQQEVGGVMVTLAALCLGQSMDMHAAGETELARIWTKVEAIRAKQAAKPKHSPLPQAVQPATITLSGHQLRIALDLINPDGPQDRDQLDDDLTFGVRQHRDDDGTVSTGMCCWNGDTDGVLPLDGEYKATAAAQPVSDAALLSAIRNGVPLEEPVSVAKAMMAQEKARASLSGGTGPLAAVFLVNIQAAPWTHTKETATAYADGFNCGVEWLRSSIIEYADKLPTQAAPEVASVSDAKGGAA